MLEQKYDLEIDFKSKDKYYTLQYDFIPESIKDSKHLVVSCDKAFGDCSQVQVLGMEASGTLKGKMDKNKSTDCLLIFDGTQFKLVPNYGSGKQLRPVRKQR